jgi:glycerol uptake facilitator-like aquaporin
MLGELLGTAALTLVVLAVSKSQLGLPYFVALATGLAVAVLVFAFGTSRGGAQLNPAITLAMWTIRKITTLEAILFVALQLIGGFLAFHLFTYFVDATIPTADLEFSGRVMVAEAVGAFILAFGWAAALYRGSKGMVLGASVGLAYITGILIASAASSALLNPAVALGAQQWEWGTYVLGPVLGALIGFNLYSLLFAAPEKVLAIAAETAVASDEPTLAVKKPAAAKKAVAVKKPAKKTTKK